MFVLSDIHLIFSTLICLTKIQIKFKFGFDPLIFHEVMALGLRELTRIISFPHFFCSCVHILFDILYVALPYQDTIQVEFGFYKKLWSVDLEIYHKFSVFRTFFLRVFRYSFDIWYIALPY